jgi:hypothetical protein
MRPVTPVILAVRGPPAEVQRRVPVPAPLATHVIPAPPTVAAGQATVDVETCKPEPSVIVMTTFPLVLFPVVVVVIV